MSDKLGNAIQLIKSGNKQAALPILKEAIRENPKDENAWLWLYSCVESVEQKKYCLQKALEINPDNQHAQNALKKLSDLTSQRAKQATPTTASPQHINKNASNRKKLKKNNLSWLWAGGVAGAVLLLCAISFFFLIQAGQIPVFAANLLFVPSATSTASHTPTIPATSTLTPSPSPTFTPIATRRPSLTPPPAPATLTPTPTIAPITPGAPTATPLGSEISDPNFKSGVIEYDKKNYEKVIDLMKAAIEANPDLAPPYRYRGMAYWYLGDCLSGLEDQEKALSIDPDYAVAWADRGLLNECVGNESQALQDYQKALSIDPTLAFVHHNLGVYYYQIGNYTKSLEEYTLSVEIDPMRSGAWSGKSEALGKLGQYDECITSANKALQIDKEEWLAYSDRAFCEFSKTNYEGAIKDYKVYVTVYSFDAGAYCYMSMSYFELKQYQNALDAAESSKALNPNCGGQRILEIQARSYYALGNYDQAIEYMNQALAEGSYKLGYYYRGIIYQDAGRKQEAIKDLKTFLSMGYDGKEYADAQARLAKLEP